MIARLAERQHGVVARFQLVAIGVDRNRIRDRRIVETDGAETHLTRAAFERDRIATPS